MTQETIIKKGEPIEVNVRIKSGSMIFQDHQIMRWPTCFPPESEYQGEKYRHKAKNPDMAFRAVWKGDYWDCVAPGYGELGTGNYGSGSIFVRGFDNVEILS